MTKEIVAISGATLKSFPRLRLYENPLRKRWKFVLPELFEI